MTDKDIFLYRDKEEGKIGIGRLPQHLIDLLSDISTKYYQQIPDKNCSTHHIWYDKMDSSLRESVNKIQNDPFWGKLCDGTDKCTNQNVKEMDELYYSNPKHKTNENLYGATTNIDIHKDCFFNFNGVRLYRILIGLTDGNESVETYFNHFDKGQKINTGDYVIFDFGKTTHQVIKDSDKPTDKRILLKMHFIVCEKCKYSKDYVNNVKNCYVIFEKITRYFMKTGTDPSTFYQFFIGLLCQYSNSPYLPYALLFLLSIILFLINYIMKIKFILKNTMKISSYTILSLTAIYFAIVFFYWIRYTLFGIR